MKSLKVLGVIFGGLLITVAFDPFTILVLVGALAGGTGVVTALLRGSDVRNWFNRNRPSYQNSAHIKALVKKKIEQGDVQVVPLYYNTEDEVIERSEYLQARDADWELRQMARQEVNLVH